MQYSLSFPTGEVTYVFNNTAKAPETLADNRKCIFVTDNHIAALYPDFLKNREVIILPAGEANKNWDSIKRLTEELLQREAHRNTMLIALGGGMVTDITGFIASVYMRGVAFGYIPTTLLAMVDAAVGGKNGINLGLHKNILGCIQQPKFILYDTSFLKTLPDEEWSNGFAEVIKYACLFDEKLFDTLSRHNIQFYKENSSALEELIATCVAWKNKTVLADEKENDNRKLLNFGHTAGHAIETLYKLPHGYAVALGMVIACIVSERTSGLNVDAKGNLSALLQQYGLPARRNIDVKAVTNLLKLDKKRNHENIDYIVLNRIGEGVVKNLSFETIQQALETFVHAGNY